MLQQKMNKKTKQTMNNREILNPKRKALRINLNDKIYGSFAEIGAGQEVARLFFQAGGASGTVARTISAYDMAFSDSLYGKSPNNRYVCEPRLKTMLDSEFKTLKGILGKSKGKDTCFFAFADTVVALNYQKTNIAHGWIGCKFQLTPQSEPNEVVIHVNMLENDNLLQQQTLGILGVNLIFACYNYYEKPNAFLQSLIDSLSTDRINIDMIRMSGPELNYVDNRLLSVQLVKNNMTHVAMFDRNGEVKQPADMLYKKNIMALRGSFRPITYVGFNMLKSGFALFKKEVEEYTKQNSMILCEMTLNNILMEGDFDERDFLARADILCGMGQNVMISDFREYYKLVGYLSKFRIKELRLIIGAETFEKVLDKKYYTYLKGGILESFGKLFAHTTKVYIYPSKKESSNNELTRLNNLQIPPDLEYLMKHLINNNRIMDIPDVKEEWLHIASRKVLEMIQNGEKGWEELVPIFISEFIKKHQLFDYKTN